MVQQAQPPPVVLAFPMGTGACPSCSTSAAAPWLCPVNAVENGSSGWAFSHMGDQKDTPGFSLAQLQLLQAFGE